MPKKKAVKSDNILVVESNSIARARLYMPDKTKSVWDERIISLIVAKNRMEDTVFKTHVISVEELTGQKKHCVTRQHRDIKNSVKNLMSSFFGVPRGNQRAETFYSVFSMIDIDKDGKITAKMNEDLHPHFLELKKCFAERFYTDFLKLKTVHVQNLYRFLNSWYRTNSEKIAKMEELHRLLDTPPTMRKNFKEFRRRILEVAHKEINAVAEKSASDNPLTFDWEPVKEGLRKVVAVRFLFNVERRRTAAMIGAFREKLKGSTRAGTADQKPAGNESHISGLFVDIVKETAQCTR